MTDAAIWVILKEQADGMNGVVLFEDFIHPDWNAGGHVHNWRNHVPWQVQKHWDSLGLTSKAVAYLMAVEASNLEEWD